MENSNAETKTHLFLTKSRTKSSHFKNSMIKFTYYLKLRTKNDYYKKSGPNA